MDLQQYIDKLNTHYKTGISTEHSFRGDLQNLLESWLPGVVVTNEPTRIKCGAPDYILTKADIPLGYIEAKDLGADLNSKSYQEQFNRYRQSLSNLVITNYLDFHAYKDGNLVATYSIGEIAGDKILPILQQEAKFQAFIADFATQVSQSIKSSQKLANMMANKAKMLAIVIDEALKSDEENKDNSTLKEQFKAFQDILIHEITFKQFADIYAQTIAYGMFAARLHDPTLQTFTRTEAAQLIPKSNPFLRKLFQYIAGFDLDGRIVWIVDALADIFRATDVAALLSNFGKATRQQDPIIHFYETFLAEYDPSLRKARGVWYTPEPVVKFIVRAVDDVLKNDFRLKDGLADTTKIKLKTSSVVKATADKRSKIRETVVEQDIHKVQILDPATGTGTFLAEVMRHIFNERFSGQQGIWSNYVESHLIPRLNGFEILMASYAMAHLKLDLLLTETGFKPTKDQRIKVYLTNSLEEHHPDTGTLFANWLSSEANEANQIKRDVPVMVVVGNPPYSVSSSNKGKWIQSLVDDYKKNLNEKKTNLDDDYIKFIRYGQHFIDKNGEGVMAYISNNSFIDGTTHRMMRLSLLNSFDKIYILDLHGSSKKQEKAPDGGSDENVFDIMQGVSINIFIKNKTKKAGTLAEVNHCDLYGSRQNKYAVLNDSGIADITWTKVDIREPNYFFVPKDFSLAHTYNEGFGMTELFKVYGSGIKTERDFLTIQFTLEEMRKVVTDFINEDETSLRTKYQIQKDSRDWKLASAIQDLKNHQGEDLYKKVYYRAFDFRYTYYTGTTRGFIGTPGAKITNHLAQDNFGLIFKRSRILGDQSIFRHFSITDTISDINFLADQSYCFPLYLYHEKTTQATIEEAPERVPNLDTQVVKEIEKKLGIGFNPAKQPNSLIKTDFGAENLLDYIYAVLNSPSYRTNYMEFLKIDFPRVPYPVNAAKFWQLVALGQRLRNIHLFKSPEVNKFVTQYPVDGSNIVEAVKYQAGKVWINSTQYFDNVPELAWNFFIGGYQPAQKWLKDRRERQLDFEEIIHYQKMIVALLLTEKIMTEIDSVESFV